MQSAWNWDILRRLVCLKIGYLRILKSVGAVGPQVWARPRMVLRKNNGLASFPFEVSQFRRNPHHIVGYIPSQYSHKIFTSPLYPHWLYPHIPIEWIRMVGFIPHRMPQVQLLWGCQLPWISTIGVRLHTYLPFQLWLPPGMRGSMGIWGSGETWDPLSCEDNRHLCVWKFNWYWSISLLGTCFWQKYICSLVRLLWRDMVGFLEDPSVF